MIKLPTLALWVREPGNVSKFPWACSPWDGLKLELAGIKARPVLIIAHIALMALLLAGCGEYPGSTDCRYKGRGVFDCGNGERP